MGKIQIKQFKSKNGVHFDIRTALPSDAEKLIEYQKTIFAEAPYLLTTADEFSTTVKQQTDLMQQILNDPNRLAILAERDGTVIGLLDFHNGHRNRIKHQGSFGMSVDFGYRGKGVGKALLAVLIEWAVKNPAIEKVSLEVFADNTNAIRLYKNFGFVEEGRKSKAIKIDDRTYHDLILMAYFINAE